jgi:hypothetical protein
MFEMLVALVLHLLKRRMDGLRTISYVEKDERYGERKIRGS